VTETVSLGVLGLKVPRGTHICTFYSGSSGRDEILMPFLAEGIRAHDKCLCITDSIGPADILPRLARQVEVAAPVETGQLQLSTPAESYLASGTFSTDDMLDYWGAVAAAMQSEGDFTLTRAAGEMPAVLNHPEGRAEFFRYEARLNEVIPNYPEVILCLYDLERWGAEVLMDTLRTHQMVIVDGMLHDNPYYVEPGRYLARAG
jgi:hypothetical protein